MSESRQLAAILFSDISGFTNTMEGDGSDSYYIDWSLYIYYNAKGNTQKANKYLTSAYNRISKDEKDKYLSDNEPTKNLHKYYYIHEIIDTYNQTIR